MKTISCSLLFLVCSAYALYAQAPSVVSFTPNANANDVARATVITVTFDKNINPETLSDSSCVVFGSLSGSHAATFQYNASTFTATITPVNSFKSGDVVWVTLTRALQSNTGDSLQHSHSWTFTAKTDSSSGIFKQISSTSVGINPFTSIAVDVNNDGYSDIVSVNNGDGTISVLKNNKDGTFSTSSTISVGANPGSVAAIDVNGDGNMDLAVAVSGENEVVILKNDGTGSFTQSSTIALGSVPWDIIAADVNGDGKADLVVTNAGSSSISILMNQGNGTFQPLSAVSVGSMPVKITAADINGDGYIDLISTNYLSNNITVLTNNGTGVFTVDTTISVGSGPYSTVAPDLFGNGLADLAVSNYGSNTISILKNNGNGSFVLSSTINVPARPVIIAAIDVNGDGNIDLVAGSTSVISILKNNGAGVFTLSSSVPLAGGGRTITPLDIDNNGSIDLAITNNVQNKVLILKNNQVPDTTKVLLIKDVPNDNGKHVFVRWTTTASPISLGMTGFALYRYDQNAWTYIRGNIPVLNDTVYQIIAPTLYDSTIINGMYWSVFRVIAQTADPSIYSIIGPDSGYSVDNIPSQAPINGEIVDTNGTTIIRWYTPPDTNSGFMGYNIYRGTTLTFIPSTQNKIAFVIDTFYVDNAAQTNTFYYKVASIDSSGNVSSALSISTMMDVKSRGNAPLLYNLYQNYPDPFNPSTMIQFTVPSDGRAILKVYNMLGQEVATLFDGIAEAGVNHQVQFNASNLASGIYFSRLEFDGKMQTKKMLLLK
jgi:hypothetical protein